MSMEASAHKVSPTLHSVRDNVVAMTSAQERSIKEIQSTIQKTAKSCDDVDDMWDNVPV